MRFCRTSPEHFAIPRLFGQLHWTLHVLNGLHGFMMCDELPQGVCHEHVGSARHPPSRSLRKSPGLRGLGNLRLPAEQKRVATPSLQFPYLPVVLYHDVHPIVHLISLDLLVQFVTAGVTSRMCSRQPHNLLDFLRQVVGPRTAFLAAGHLCKRSATATPDWSSQH